MKKCPTCNREYADDSLRFCLEDGSRLSGQSGPEATLVMPTRDTHPRNPTPAGASPSNVVARPTNAKGIYLLITLVALLLGGGIVAFLKSSSSNPKTTAAQSDPSASANTSGVKISNSTPVAKALTPKKTTPRGAMVGGQQYGLYYQNLDNSLEAGVAYKFPNDNTTYIYDGVEFRPVVSEQAYFRFYGCRGNLRVIDCAPVYEMPGYVTSEMLHGPAIR